MRSVLVTDTRYSVRQFRAAPPARGIAADVRARGAARDSTRAATCWLRRGVRGWRTRGPNRSNAARRSTGRPCSESCTPRGTAVRRPDAAGRCGGAVRAAFQRAARSAGGRAQRGGRAAPVRVVRGRGAHPAGASAERGDPELAWGVGGTGSGEEQHRGAGGVVGCGPKPLQKGRPKITSVILRRPATSADWTFRPSADTLPLPTEISEGPSTPLRLRLNGMTEVSSGIHLSDSLPSRPARRGLHARRRARQPLQAPPPRRRPPFLLGFTDANSPSPSSSADTRCASSRGCAPPWKPWATSGADATSRPADAWGAGCSTNVSRR